MSWQRGQQVVLEKNPDYWKGPVKLDRVIYRPIVEDQARLTELLTGASRPDRGRAARLRRPARGQPQGEHPASRSGAHVWYLGINNQKKPFDDKRVRQALNYAVNKDAIVKDVLKGTGASSSGPVLPGTWGAEPALKAYPYDPQRAKKLLAGGRLPERLLHDHVGAGVRVGHAVAGGDGHGDAVEPQGRRRQRHAADDGVGRVSSPSSARRSRSCSRCRGWRAPRTRTW